MIALAACATLEALGIRPLRFAESDERPSELRILGPSSTRPLGGGAIRLWAEVENPNDFGLTLAEVAGDLRITDAAAIAVDFPLGLPLLARQDTLVPLDVSIGFHDVPRLAEIVHAAATAGVVSYRLDGAFVVDAGNLGQPRFGPLTLLSGELRIR